MSSGFAQVSEAIGRREARLEAFGDDAERSGFGVDRRTLEDEG
jgi:hypothetical protein